ncbi:MAG: TetR/AcrR family transcriptional regulator [Nitrosopumilus sp.]
MAKITSKNQKDVRERILVSATKNFAKKGYTLTSLKEIAISAKMSKGGLYHHFPSKEDLFFAVCSQNVKRTMEKTIEFFEKKQIFQLCKEDTLLEDLSEYYDNIVLGAKDLERLWLEGMMEADHNPKLKKMLLKMEKENSTWGIEALKKIRDTSNLLQGYSDLELHDITNGFSALYKGILVDRLMGKSLKDIRMTWIRTVYAIYHSKK